MNNKELPDCSKSCLKDKKNCKISDCRLWVDYEEDNNCSLISIYQNGPMTLDEISKRLQISLVRVSQIEKSAIKKLYKRIKI